MPAEKIQKELVIIDSLLRSKSFAYEMAKAVDAGYYGGESETFSAADDTDIIKTVKDEKIATSLAGFYAVECGVGLLCEHSQQTPVQWLKKIADQTTDSNVVLLLNRFANATWKAGQPFRGLDRIKRYNFTGAGYLSAEEIEKDYNQVTSAATLLLEHMLPVENSSLPEQMKQLKTLLQDGAFAIKMAQFIDASYYRSQHRAAPVFLSEADENEIITKSKKEQKIATAIAGFYALETGINYLVTTKSVVPSNLLKSIENNTVDETDRTLFLRLANATWKAGQPFIDINRISKEDFTPVYFLSKADIEKDMVQIKSASGKLLQSMQETGQ